MGVVVLAATWFAISRLRQTPSDVPMTAVPLLTYLGDLGGPTFSPDGNEIAFGWNGEKQDNYDIYRKLIGPGEALRLTRDPAPDIRPAWSPDGRFIAFCRFVACCNSWGVYIIPALGGPERRLAQISSPIVPSLNLAWTPDGRWLVASDENGPGQPHGLHLISIETGEKIRLTTPPRSWNVSGDSGASFSPDGRSLAFVRSLDAGSSDIYRIWLAGDYRASGDPERLTYEDRALESPVWTHDGKQILYSSGNTSTSVRLVRRIMLSGSKSGSGYPTAQESFGEDAVELAISRSGRRLVYLRRHWDRNIYRIELRDKDGRVGTPQKFIASTQPEAEPDYSPDGKMISFCSTRSGTEEVWVCNADGSNPRQLTSMGGPWTGDARWSPDSKTLVFDSLKEGSMDLYLVSADGGSPRRLTSHPKTETDPSWSRDGKWIYFWSDRGGEAQVYRMPAQGGEAIQVTRKGGLYTSESPDGKWLYYSKPSAGDFAIWKVPPGGGEESQFLEGPVTGQSYNFVVVDDGIYFTTGGTPAFGDWDYYSTVAPGTLAFRDFKSGKTMNVCKVDKLWHRGLPISPDHRWILCSLLEESSNALMLVENFR